MSGEKMPLVIIAGPTAAGKSAAAVALCQRIGGEVISGDSMQVYRGMDIGTAKITKEEMRGIPHHLIDVADPKDPWNAYLFKEKAEEAVSAIHDAGRVPVICGGTGFYIDALLGDTEFTVQDDGGQIRSRLTEIADKEGGAVLHRMLEEADPEAAAQIHPNNVKRVIRALEYHALTGERISDHNAAQHAKEPPYAYRYFAVTMERDALYQRIDARVSNMLEQGLVEEVRSLRESGCDRSLTSMQGIGYKEILNYLDGQCTLAEAADRIRLGTRHYAKRQLTWLRRRSDVIWLSREEYPDASDLAAAMEKEITGSIIHQGGTYAGTTS